jgi:hypothetical protein
MAILPGTAALNEECLHSQVAKLYVVSESGTIEPLKIVDTLKAMPLLPGGSIIVPPDF